MGKSSARIRHLLLLALGSLPSIAGAGQVALDKFALLREGMSEAEVFYRLGPFDYENAGSNPHHEVVQKIWYYVPDGKTSGEWITEITFDQHGRVKRLDRYKPGR
jgi:hypothetical protein